jgi:hypothetical protein
LLLNHPLVVQLIFALVQYLARSPLAISFCLKRIYSF